MIRGQCAAIALLLSACRAAPGPFDAGAPGPSTQDADAGPSSNPIDAPSVTFRLRARDEAAQTGLSMVVREARLGPELEVVDWPGRQGRPKTDPPILFARTRPLGRAEVAQLWSALESAGIWTAATHDAGTHELEARFGQHVRHARFRASDPLAAILAPALALANLPDLEQHTRAHVAFLEGPPADAPPIPTDPTRVLLEQQSPDGARLVYSLEGDLLRVTRRWPQVVRARRRRLERVWVQRDRWLPRDALDEAVARAAAAGLWELVDPASPSPQATHLTLHIGERDLTLALPPGPEPTATFQALQPLRAIAP